MRRALSLLLLAAVAFDIVRAQAAEVSLSREAGMISVRVHGIAVPANLSTGLTSRLANRLYARVSLFETGRFVGQRAVEITVRYDLWEERFSIVSTIDDAIVDSRNVAKLAEVTTFLNSLPLPKLFNTDGLPDASDLAVRVELLLNPISREKVRMIRKWVTQNTAPVIEGEQGPSVSNTLFNRIFEQYSSDSDVAAAWRTDVVSAAFRVGDLK